MDKVKHLLPQTQYFKANLHTHSSVSDGGMTPEEVKQAYKAKGYQILSLTDHRIIVDHSALNDADFLMLTGMEVDITPKTLTEIRGPYHLNLIAKRPDNLWSPIAAPTDSPYAAQMQWENMDLHCTPESINKMIAKANEKGFLVTYNHPVWSGHGYPAYASLEGLWAIELRNSACCEEGFQENNFQVHKDMLCLGKRLFPIGADDMHAYWPDSLGQSWIMVGAEALDYDAVIKALEKGDFYMSCGPEINTLTVENGILKITCSGVKRICIESERRFANLVKAKDGQLLYEAEFDLTEWRKNTASDPNACVRLTIFAEDGTYAATRGYYTSELV